MGNYPTNNPCGEIPMPEERISDPNDIFHNLERKNSPFLDYNDLKILCPYMEFDKCEGMGGYIVKYDKKNKTFTRNGYQCNTRILPHFHIPLDVIQTHDSATDYPIHTFAKTDTALFMELVDDIMETLKGEGFAIMNGITFFLDQSTWTYQVKAHGLWSGKKAKQEKIKLILDTQDLKDLQDNGDSIL